MTMQKGYHEINIFLQRLLYSLLLLCMYVCIGVVVYSTNQPFHSFIQLIIIVVIIETKSMEMLGVGHYVGCSVEVVQFLGYTTYEREGEQPLGTSAS